MKERAIIIKQRNGGLFAKGIIFLLLMLISLFGALSPMMISEISDIAIYFYITGGVLFAVFTALFITLLIKESNPENALVLNSRGFIDLKNVGSDIEIEWTNVASVKLIDRRDNPLLGITLENPDIVLAKMKKKQAAEMRENIEENLPAILIAQSDIRMPIEELKKHFTKLAREARVLEQTAQQPKPKTNPFTTDDVLRAFGKLPKENEKEDVQSEVITPEEAPTPDESSNEVIQNEKATAVNNADSFYNSLFDSANAASEQPAENIAENFDSNESVTPDKDTEYMPPEIQELLERAKSTRISEIEKILIDPNAPVTHRTESDKSTVSTAEAKTVLTETVDNTPEADVTENNASEIDELTIDNLIEALPDTEELFEEVYLKPKMEPEAEDQIQTIKPVNAPQTSPSAADAEEFGFVVFDENEEDEDYANSARLSAEESDEDMIFITDIDGD